MASKLAGFELACDLLFDEVPCYISIQDRDLRVLQANRTLKSEFGDPTSKNCFAVYKGRSESCPECPVARTFEDGKDRSSEEVIFDRRGLSHNVLARTHPLRDGQGQIVAVMELFSDITVQKELEHRLHDTLNRFHHLFDLAPSYVSVQNRELRVVEANDHFKESLGDPAGGHCYEIYKTRGEPCPECPVMATFGDGETHTGEHVWVDRNGKEVLVVVQTAPIRDRRGQIADLCRDVVSLFEPRARECGIRLETEISDPGAAMLGEPKDIQSLVANLVTNALDACCSDQDPEKAHRVAVRSFLGPGEVVIEVEDNGIGMDEETRGKLFTAFFSTKGAFGTGLGVLVLHRFATEHGGVSVRSQPGQGATFTVRFPVQPRKIPTT